MIELTCQVCGETYSGDSSSETHQITLDGEFCGGRGTVTGSFWPRGRSQDMGKAEKRQARPEADALRFSVQYKEFVLDDIVEIVDAARVTAGEEFNENESFSMADAHIRLAQGNETNRLLAGLTSGIIQLTDMLSYTIR